MSSHRRLVVRAVLLAVSLAALALPVQAAGPASKSLLAKSEVRAAEQRLATLGYWTGPIDGVWDAVSRQGLIAFQKVEHAKATGALTRAEYNALFMAAPPRPREMSGPHIEVDLARQVLFLVDGEGKVGNILPVSSGSGKTFHQNGYPETHAITPCGHLEVFSTAAGWKTSPLGEMYNPLYIVGGIAIHGSLSVPAYPASHGCIRVPMFASERLPRMVPKGTRVFVYGCKDERPVEQIAVTSSSSPALVSAGE